MNPAAEGPLSLRPEHPDDESFLLALYATTRQEELNLTNWDTNTRDTFVRGQFRAMRSGYASMFPEGQFSIVLLAGQAIGRLVINRTEHDLLVVDMVLLPEFCGQGLGRRLMTDILAEAAAGRKNVHLHVLKMNRASRFYERLGFVKIADEGLYDKMRWQPPL